MDVYTSISNIVSDALHRKCYEPVPRLYAGSGTPVYVRHRFPIKGGISSVEVLARNVAHHNALFARLVQGRPTAGR